MANAKSDFNACIKRLAGLAREQLGEPLFGRFEPFLSHYFQHVDPDLLTGMSSQAALDIVVGHWQLASQRRRGQPTVRVGNPDGGDSTATVIEIVTDNMPFLVDSMQMEMNHQGRAIRFAVHPVYEVERDAKGSLKLAQAPLRGADASRSKRESFIYFQIDRVLEADELAAIDKRLHKVLKHVRYAVTDWPKMRRHLHDLVDTLPQITSADPPARVAEVCEFLHWLDQQNFTFLGFQRYQARLDKQLVRLTPVPGSALGLMRSNKRFLAEDYASEGEAGLLLISKSVQRSTVHRPGHLDYIIVREFDRQGRITAENRFVGLYTSNAYRRHPRDVPIIRSKIDAVFARSGFDPVSHIGKAFAHILETFPRDELFQIDEDELFGIARSLLHLGDRQRLRLFIRADKLRRFVTCLIYVPRDHYDTALRLRMAEVIRRELAAESIDFNVRLTDENFARVEFFIRTDAANFPRYDVDALERTLEAMAQSWLDLLKRQLLGEFEERQCARLLSRYGSAFPASYQEDFNIVQAVQDIARLEQLNLESSLAVNVYQAPNGQLRLKLYKLGEAIAPSDSLPILENMGVRVLQETPYDIVQADGSVVWIHDHGLQCKMATTAFDQFKTDFEEIFAAAWLGQIENDGFNALGLMASLSAREISLLRAYCKYLLQAGLPYSQAYIESCLTRHAAISAMLLRFFECRFDPARQTNSADEAQRIENDIRTQLDQISSLDEDRILRNFLGLILATVRTSYYRPQRPCHAFKFASARVPELPDPRPLFEIFVYSPRVEGVHLRAGKVARGGLRWSDRREDFRTEILGLVKAQKVKNAVIVPTGAKGGFVVKRPPAGGDRDALLNEGIACYRLFIGALLDITDNIVDGKVLPPPSVVRHDEDDPYFVVAADKGTAAFSDIANSVAEEYGFWLGDAFASGGSKGYDHKKMGITARGAWESVKLLFRDVGKDIQKEPFSVIGIGDMSGDVFGNGMLLSKQIRLVGAFNHLHIFLDPDPDPASSFRERERLFRLPRSSWADYNAELISRGGGIFPRSLKSVPLSKEVQKLLGVDKKSLPPNELIRLLLQAPVDLLWNGGIGTYVKASHQQHTDVGDRSNDVLRVDASALRCRVVGEGGNLGMTHAARIEFSLNGGLVDSDFIHNAGGVDCSDHEVNIKILLQQAVGAGLLNETQRVKLLEQMTGEVAELVLQSNYWQEQAITLIDAQAARLLDEHARYMRRLESDGQLQRALEGLPNDEQLIERRALGRGLTRPEIAVLVSYSKIIAEAALVDSDLWQDAYFANELLRYFPRELRERFAKQIHAHPLRAEILSTFIVNRMINRMGCTYLFRMQEETGASAALVARVYTIAWEVFELRRMWAEIAALDNKVPASVQINMMLEAVRLIDRAGKWLLNHRKRLTSVGDVINDYRAGAGVLLQRMTAMIEVSEDVSIKKTLRAYVDRGVEQAMAVKVVAMDALYCTFDVVDLARANSWPLEAVIDVYFALSAYLDVFWLRVRMRDYQPASHWQELACKSQLDDLYHLLGQLTQEVLRGASQSVEPRQCIVDWHAEHRDAVDRCLRIAQELRAIEHVDFAMFAVALRELQNLLLACRAG